MSAPADTTPEPGTLDLGTLALFVGHALAEESLRALARSGFEGVRLAHGFVFQHLVDGPRTIGELAERLQVTQQGASKAVAELEALGYLERTTTAEDGRVRLVTFSPRGRALLASGRRARAALERRLAARFGAEALDATRALLAGVLESLGGAEAVRRRRVVAPR